MLVQFTVENFLSIRDKVYLSLEPSKDSEHPENLITKGDYKAVNSVAIYGANASGKSSLFKAITVALIMIRNSNNVQITDKLPMTPFKLILNREISLHRLNLPLLQKMVGNTFMDLVQQLKKSLKNIYIAIIHRSQHYYLT